ncbi:unnamed protein product, partial [Pylaiella littoralis]
MALVAAIEEKNIAVWEAKDGGGIRLYQNGHETGLFIGNSEDIGEFVHLLYSNGNCTISKLQDGTYPVRNSRVTSQATSNHFDNIWV